jgi:hypothetical protein
VLFKLTTGRKKMLAKRHITCLALFAIALGAALSACGGGGGGGTTTPSTITPTVTLNFIPQATELVGSPTFAFKSVSLSNTTTTSTAPEVIGYTRNTTTGVITLTGPYTFAGDPSSAALTVCKPASAVEGNIDAADVYAKTIYVGMPTTAVAGTIDDLKGKTFDIYDNCALTGSAVFDSSANGTLLQGTSSVAFTAADIADLLRPEGFTTIQGTDAARTDTRDQYQVFKTAGKVVLVTRRLILQPLKNVDNTNGELGAWFSR